MARVSAKALQPRQYVFSRLSADRIALLSGGVKKLLDKEMHAVTVARAAAKALERREAARHAENIMAGIHTSDAENEQIRALEAELEELRDRKRRLFVMLRKTLDSERKADAKRDTKRKTEPEQHTVASNDVAMSKRPVSSSASAAPSSERKQAPNASGTAKKQSVLPGKRKEADQDSSSRQNANLL